MRRVFAFALAASMLLAIARAQDGQTAQPPATVVPTPGTEDRATLAGWHNGPWQRQHDDCCALARLGGFDLLLLGDSITQGFGGEGRAVDAPGAAAAAKHFAPWRTANMGISGDRTQHLLWRLQHGAVDGLDPRFAVLTIGINNLHGGDRAADVAAGILACARELAQRLPHAQIVVHGALPAGRSRDEPLRRSVVATNALVAAGALPPNVACMDVGAALLTEDGDLQPGLHADDGIHLTAAGYDAWAARLGAELARRDAARRRHVVFVAGDEEYRSEESLPMLAAILARVLHCRTTVCLPRDKGGKVDPQTLDHIDGLQALDGADGMVLFTRFRALPEAEFRRIDRFVGKGRAVAGFRTATHAFRYADPALAARNGDWSRNLFGQHWLVHHGHFDDGKAPLTDVAFAPPFAPEQRAHPILRGVQPFAAYSWLYHVQGGGDELHDVADILLLGTARKSDLADTTRYPRTQPVAWTRRVRRDGGEQRVFFTTLGHPFDFEDPSMRRLAVQGIVWSLGLDDAIPAAGMNVDFALPYDPPNSGVGGHRRG